MVIFIIVIVIVIIINNISTFIYDLFLKFILSEIITFNILCS